MQAWADNLLLTARKMGAPVDRRRDGSQESCTTAALHHLQQELGMAQQAAQGGHLPDSCSVSHAEVSLHGDQMAMA